jgi:hypothetical protein
LGELKQGLASQYLAAAAATARTRERFEDDDLTKGLANPESVTELCLAELENVTNMGVSSLGGLPNLQSLWLDRLAIDGQGLTGLASINALRKLSLCKTRVTDSCMDAVCRIPNLERLYLDRTGVSDTGFSRLADIKTLKYVSVFGCKRLSRDVWKLKQVLPQADIRR